MAKRIFFICLAILFVAISASAEPYFGLGVLRVDLRDSDISVSERDGTDAQLSFDRGWGAMVVLGQQDEHLRLEVEAAYRRNDLDTVLDTDLDGKFNTISAMINGYLHFDTLFHPFIGAGAGRARIEEDLREAGSERDNVFAWQGLAGISFPMNPGWFDIGYRYFATDEPEFNGVQAEYKTHNVYFAFRF